MSIIERQSALKKIKQKDKEIISEILQKLKLDKRATGFLLPVDLKNNPDYLRIIKNEPMDISKIETKLNNNKYCLVQDIIYDFQLMWENCRIYNVEISEIYKNSLALEKIVDEEFSKYYIYRKRENKNVSYKEIFEKNIYNEDSFNDVDFLEKNGSEILKEEELPKYCFLYYKMKLQKLIKKLTNDNRRILFELIIGGSNNENNNNCIVNEEEKELNNLNKYINDDNEETFKFDIEKMEKKDLLKMIEFIKKKFGDSIDNNE